MILAKSFLVHCVTGKFIFWTQTIMTFLGLSDGETDMDSDTGDVELPFEIFTLRNLINFLLGVGLEFLYNSIENKTVLIIISVIVGYYSLPLFS
jgi:hypothetical protein